LGAADLIDGDEQLANQWLANERLMPDLSAMKPYEFEVPDSYDWNVRNSATDLLLDNNQRQRAWRFVQSLLRLSADEGDLTIVAVGALEPMLRVSGDHLLAEIRKAILEDRKLRAALKKVYLHGKVRELAERYGLQE
jgi:hypothetical protein